MQQTSFIQSLESNFQDGRLSGLGGSDAAATYSIGMKCKRQTAYSKRRTPQDFTKGETPEMERGIFTEDVCRRLYEARTGRKVKTMPLARHPEKDWMIVHVDGETTSPQKPGPGYWEGKVVNAFMFRKFKKEGLREEYILQLQHGMAVKDYQWGSFGILCLDPWQFAWFDVDRDQEIIDKLIPDEEAYWVQIQNGPLPEALPAKDKRCATCAWRKTCQGEAMLATLPKTEEGKEVIPEPALLPLVEEVSELGEIVDEAKELHEEAKDRLKKAIGDRYGIVVPGFRALYPPSWPERWDSDALKSLKKEAQELVAADWGFDFSAVEEWSGRAAKWFMSFLKAQKTTPKDKPVKSLRIYPTGD